MYDQHRSDQLAIEKQIAANRMFSRYDFGEVPKSVAEWESGNPGRLVWSEEKEAVRKVWFEGEGDQADTKGFLTVEFAANGGSAEIARVKAIDENKNAIGRIRQEDYPRFQELMGNSSVVFLADGVNVIPDAPSPICFVCEVHSSDDELQYWVMDECLETGKSSQRHAVDSDEDLRTLFDEQKFGEFSIVYKDDLGLHQDNDISISPG